MNPRNPRNRSGRKPTTGVVLWLRIPPAMKLQLESQAAEESRSLAAVGRRAIEEYLVGRGKKVA